jgi:hypothetical protein
MPGSPITPTTPATTPNYGSYGPRAGDSIRVPSDEQQARFAAASTPIQKPVPPQQNQLAAASYSPFTPNAGAQAPIKQAAYDETPAVGQSSAQQLSIREVTPAEYQMGATSETTTTTTPTRDGFRPQSGEQRAEAVTESPVKGFRSPVVGNATIASDAMYGVGPTQEWLRGQLEYWPQTGEWSIKYMPDGQVDQIGGRILIDNPQVLGHLPPGEFVMVEGQVFGRQIDDASYRPAYRVAVVQRQSK